MKNNSIIKYSIYSLFLSLLIGCQSTEKPQEDRYARADKHLETFTQENMKKAVDEFAKSNNLLTNPEDTLFFFDQEFCYICTAMKGVKALEPLDKTNWHIVTFRDTTYEWFSDRFADTKIVFSTDSSLLKERIYHNMPYKYFRDKNGNIQNEKAVEIY